MIIPQQCRAARAALGWSAADLAKRAGVSSATVLLFEQRKNEFPLKPTTVDLICGALAKGGVVIGRDGDHAVIKFKAGDAR